jgi:hypothetical protein
MPPAASWNAAMRPLYAAAAAIPGGWASRRRKRTRSQDERGEPTWNPAQDAAMRMHNEVAKRPTCLECRYGDGRHARMCSRARA